MVRGAVDEGWELEMCVVGVGGGMVSPNLPKRVSRLYPSRLAISDQMTKSSKSFRTLATTNGPGCIHTLLHNTF